MKTTTTTTTHTIFSRRQTARLLRQVVVASVVCLVIYCLMLGRQPDLLDSSSLSSWPQEAATKISTSSDDYDYDHKDDDDGAVLGRQHPLPPGALDNRSLTEEQCRIYFPGLLKEVDDAVAKGPFALRPRNQTGHLGPLVARIKDGKVCSHFFNADNVHFGGGGEETYTYHNYKYMSV